MARVSTESNIPATTSEPDMIKELLKMKVILDEKEVEPTGRKLEINKEAYMKVAASLNALDTFLNCEVIISTQFIFAKMWGRTK